MKLERRLSSGWTSGSLRYWQPNRRSAPRHSRSAVETSSLCSLGPGGPWVKGVQRILLDLVLANPLLNETATLEGLVTQWAHDTDAGTEGEGHS